MRADVALSRFADRVEAALDTRSQRGLANAMVGGAAVLGLFAFSRWPAGGAVAGAFVLLGAGFVVRGLPRAWVERPRLSPKRLSK